MAFEIPEECPCCNAVLTDPSRESLLRILTAYLAEQVQTMSLHPPVNSECETLQQGALCSSPGGASWHSTGKTVQESGVKGGAHGLWGSCQG